MFNVLATRDTDRREVLLTPCTVLPAVVTTRLLSTLTLLGLMILLVSPIPAILRPLEMAILIVLLFVAVAILRLLKPPRVLLTRPRTPRVRPTTPVTPFGTLLGNLFSPVTRGFFVPQP